jgi:electron transport complex protein RnfG
VHKFYPILALTVVALISVASLSGVYNLTDEAIAYQRWLRTEKMLEGIFPPMDCFNENDIFTIYSANAVIGHAFEAEGRGFGGPITILVGIKNETIAGIGIVTHTETPGLGDRIEGPDFLNRFVGVDVDYVALPPEGRIDGITGATISVKAVIDAVRVGTMEFLRGQQ